MKKSTEMNFNEAPAMWALCFNQDCQMKERCLRFAVGQQVTDKTCGRAVYPNALKDGACDYFQELRIVRAACGFGDIFANVKSRHAATMRLKLEQYLGGHGTYYRYKNGTRLLMPEQQEWIRQLFRSYGYDETVVFNSYLDVFDFG